MYYGGKRIAEPIRWAMVGGGNGAQIGYIHRSSALRDFNFDLAAGAFDVNAERGREFGKQLHVAEDRCYPDYKTMFTAEAKRADGVQAVSIATPNGTHYEITKAALQAGLHVVCEKPLCFTTKEAEELGRLAKEKNKVVGVTYGYSGHQMIEEARQLIADGKLGKIRIVNMQFAHGFHNVAVEQNTESTRWRVDPKVAGPSYVLGDLATHPLYLSEVRFGRLPSSHKTRLSLRCGHRKIHLLGVFPALCSLLPEAFPQVSHSPSDNNQSSLCLPSLQPSDPF